MSTFAQGHANLLGIVPNTDSDKQRKKKGDKNTDVLRAVQMLTHVHQIPTQLTKQQNDQGHESFRRNQKNKYGDPEKLVFSSKLSTT